MKEKEYRIVWEIDLIETTPRGAAEQALRIQRDPESIATAFTVYDREKEFDSYNVDLSQPQPFTHATSEEPTMNDIQKKANDLLLVLDDAMTLDYFMENCVQPEVTDVDKTEVCVESIEFNVTYNRHGRPSVDIESIEVEVPSSAVTVEPEIGDCSISGSTSLVPPETIREITDFLKRVSGQSDEPDYREMYLELKVAAHDLVAALVRIEERFGKVR
jgi:hypothetical protein